MLKSSFFEILGALSRKELKSFGDFLSSPFHNKNENLLKLYSLIKKYHPQFDSPKLEKEKLFGELYPGRKYNDNTMRTLLFEFTNQVHNYLAINSLLNNETEVQRILLMEFNKRGMDKHFIKMTNKLKENLNKIDDREEFYFQQFLLEKQKHLYMGKHHTLVPQDNFTVQMEYLRKFFILRTLDIYSYYLNKQLNVKVEVQYDLLDELLEHIKQKGYADEPMIIYKYNCIKLLRNIERDDYYKKVKDFLTDDKSNISKSERHNGYVLLQNIIIWKMQKGKTECLAELENLYSEMLNKKIYAESDSLYMSHTIFRNIVVIMLRYERNEWVEKFIKEFSSKLAPANRENAVNLAIARLHFSRRSYQQCLVTLNKVPYEDIFYRMEIKVLETKAQYELGNFDTVMDVLDSFRHMIRNKLLTDHFAELSSNFIKFVNKLLKIESSNTNADKAEIESFRKELNIVNIPSKDWLLKKIEELEKKNGRQKKLENKD